MIQNTGTWQAGISKTGGEFHVSLEPFSWENLKHLRQGAIRVSRTRADISAGLSLVSWARMCWW